MLARADAQTTLGSLADDVLTAAAEPELAAAGFTLKLDSRADRSDLVAVVRLLLGWGVLSRIAGDEDAYLSAGTDVLYDVHRPVLGVLLSGIRGPSTVTAATFAGAARGADRGTGRRERRPAQSGAALATYPAPAR